MNIDVFTNDLRATRDDIVGWRHHIHRHPELSFEEHGTAAFVVARLREFGFERIATGIGGTGIVATLSNGSGPRAIGLRAELDALPIEEAGDAAHRSRTPGVMHACGHDGHTAMLLGAAKHLAATRCFDGTVHFVFQPAEETLRDGDEPGRQGGGADAMMRDGLFRRFPMDAIFGLHNRPGIEAGRLAGKTGVLYAAVDKLEIVIAGRGGHPARPHLNVDPIFVACQVMAGLQSLVSRTVDPLGSAVVAICSFQSGTAFNVTPGTAALGGTVRTLSTNVQDRIERDIRHLVPSIAEGYGATADVRYTRGHPPVRNDDALFTEIRGIARELVGTDSFVDLDEPTMSAEDFACYARETPSCFMLLGNGELGETGAMLHNPSYDFNDGVATLGAAYWVRLVERLLPVATVAER